MLQTIVIYGVVFLLMILLAVLYSESKSRRVLSNPYIICIIILYTLVFGLRYDVGVDYVAYLKAFLYVRHHPSVMVFREPLWVGFMLLLHKFDAHYTVFFMAIAFVQILFLCKAFTINKKLFPYFIFIFFACGYFLMFQNTMRQCVAFSIMLCVLMHQPEISFLKYLLLALCLSLIHISAFFIVILYPLFRYDRFFIKSTFLRVAVYVGAVVIGYSFHVFDFLVNTNIFVLALDSTEYSNYKHTLDMGMERTFGAGYIVKILINCVIFYYANVVCRFFTKEKGFKRWLNIYYFGSVLFVMFPTNMLIQRLNDYLLIWAIPVFAYFCYFVIKTKVRRQSLIKQLGYVCIIGLVLLNLNTMLIKPAGMHSFYHFWTETPYPGYEYYFNKNHK